MQITSDITTFKKENKKVTGDLYIEFDKGYFPEKNWNDFVVIIANWWLESAIYMESNKQFDCVFNFMDGPYSFHAKGDTDKTSIILKEKGLAYKTVIITKRELISEIRRFALQVSKKCKKENWEDEDTKSLNFKLDNSPAQ